MQVQEKIKINLQAKKNDIRFQVLLLNVENSLKSFKCEILGRRFVDWIAFACGELSIVLRNYDKKESLIDFAKKHIDSAFDYTIILMSSTPLIEKDVIVRLVDYCKFKQISICKLPVGYVVKNDYILNFPNLIVDSIYSQDMESFYLVENKKQYNYACNILQERVNNFHISNGVEIKKSQSVYIEPEVDIANGVIIYPNNSLKGKTTIGKDVILKENNVISNSKIGHSCCISGSNIEESVIANGVYVASFCDIKDSLIGSDSSISSGCKIYKYNVNAETKLKANEVLGEDDDSNSGSGQSR